MTRPSRCAAYPQTFISEIMLQETRQRTIRQTLMPLRVGYRSFTGFKALVCNHLPTLLALQISVLIKFRRTFRCCAYRKSNPDIFVMQSAEDRAAKNTPCPHYGGR